MTAVGRVFERKKKELASTRTSTSKQKQEQDGTRRSVNLIQKRADGLGWAIFYVVYRANLGAIYNI